MSTVLTNLCEALMWGIPLLLLVGRFCWPRRLPWWVVVLGAACASWILYEAQIQLRYGVLLDEVAACQAAGAGGPPPECPMALVDYWDLPAYLRWAPGITSLVLLLPVYGAVNLLRRRRQTNAA